MNRYFIHNILFRLLAPTVYGVLVYFLILLLNNSVAQINTIMSSRELYLCIGLTYLLFESIRFMIILLDKFLGEKYQATRIPIQFLITTVVSVLMVLIGLTYSFKAMEGFSISLNQLLLFAAVYIITALLYNVLHISNYYLQKENTLKLKVEKNQRDVLELEMQEFRNDINPDLLYEGLENLITLLYRDVEEAEQYIDCMASAYRYVLTNRHQELVPVSVELQAARNVLRLLNENYQQQIRLESSLNTKELDAMLIPGSLPIIIESMVRNTIISRFEPLVIRCYLEYDYITLQGKLNDKLQLHTGSQLALERLQKSYSLYSNQPMITVKAYQENYIKLPVIHVAEEMTLI